MSRESLLKVGLSEDENSSILGDGSDRSEQAQEHELLHDVQIVVAGRLQEIRD